VGTRELLVEIGKRVKGRLAFEQVDEASVDDGWLDELRAEASAGKDEVARIIVGMLGDPILMAVVPWAATWSEQGNPRIKIGPRLAASLMATTIPPEDAAHIRLPWRAALIQLPDALVFGDTATGARESMRHVLGWTFPGGEVGVRVLSEQRTAWAIRSSPMGGFGEEDDLGRGMGPQVDSIEKRSLLLVRRLILGVSASLAEPEGSLPGVARVGLPRALKADCRVAVHGYVTEDGMANEAAWTITRGHWKRQNHKTGAWAWVQPHWGRAVDEPSTVTMRVVRDG
jgi:hypothetical protein